MIADLHPDYVRIAARLLGPRELPDIVDWLEGRAFTTDPRTGARVSIPALQIVDKESEYRGPFSTESCPDLREIIRSCVSPEVETVVQVGPGQAFKTTGLLGVAAYTVGVDHGPVGWVMDSTTTCQGFSQKRFQPCVDATPHLAALKPANPDDYKTLELGFRTCTVRFLGSNSAGRLASFPYKRVIGDEVDKYPQQIRDEASALDLLLIRTKAYAHHNHLFASTPTVPYGTIWQAALRGDCRRYHVPCRRCSRLFVQRFSTDRTTLVWDDTARHANGTWDLDRVARTVHYRCPHCGAEHFENHRRDLLHNGVWIPDPKETADAARADYGLVADPRCRSYFRSCFNVLHPNRTYAAIAREFLLAGRDPSKLQNFTNSTLGEVYNTTIAAPDWKVLADRAENYPGDPPLETGTPPDPATLNAPLTDLLPPGVVLLTAGVDRQAEPPRLEYEIVGWGEDYESWGIEYGQILRSAHHSWRECWDELDRRLLKIWHMRVPDTDLTCPLNVASTAVDTGHDTDDCYDYVKRCQASGRRVIAVKGSSEGYGQPLLERPKKSGVRKVELWMVGTTTAKAELYSWLRNSEPATTGYLHFPKHPKRGYDQQWFQQIRAEVCEKRRLGGRDLIRFHKPTGARNEALDIRVYARAAHHYLNPKLEKIKAKLDAATALHPELPLGATEPSALSHETRPPADNSGDSGSLRDSEGLRNHDSDRPREETVRGDVLVPDEVRQVSLDAPITKAALTDAAQPAPRVLPVDRPPAETPNPERQTPNAREARPNSYEVQNAKPQTPNPKLTHPRPARLPRRSWATRW